MPKAISACLINYTHMHVLIHDMDPVCTCMSYNRAYLEQFGFCSQSLNNSFNVNKLLIIKNIFLFCVLQTNNYFVLLLQGKYFKFFKVHS